MSIGPGADPGLGSKPAGDIVINPLVGGHYFPPGSIIWYRSEGSDAFWLGR